MCNSRKIAVQILPKRQIVDTRTGEISNYTDVALPNAKHYLDYSDKTHKNLLKDSPSPPNLGLATCVSGYITGSCVNGHNVAKIIYCGREYCWDCGQKDSAIHQRRVGNWFDKVHSLESLGYLVITFPKELRKKLLATDEQINERAEIKKETGRSIGIENQKLMQKFSTALKRYLVDKGYTRGMYRWHWAGDCPHCKDETTKDNKGCLKCNYTGAGRTWKPHLNILIEEHFMSREQLTRIKSFCKKWMNNNMNADLKKNIVCHYQYTVDSAKKTHVLKYITRATWRYEKNFIVCRSIYDFKGTSRSWGKFNIEGESKSELIQLIKGICPVCTAQNKKGITLKWSKFMNRAEAQEELIKAMEQYDGGYFRMKDTPKPEIIKPPPKFGLVPFVEYEQTANIKKLKKEIEAYYKENPGQKEISKTKRLEYLEMLLGK